MVPFFVQNDTFKKIPICIKLTRGLFPEQTVHRSGNCSGNCEQSPEQFPEQFRNSSVTVPSRNSSGKTVRHRASRLHARNPLFFGGPVPELFRNSSGTFPGTVPGNCFGNGSGELFRNSSGTVPELFRNSSGTVPVGNYPSPSGR